MPRSAICLVRPLLTAESGSGLAVLQGYDVDIRHIPGKKNPADSLSRQQVADALVCKISVTDANASYVQKLWVAENAIDEEVQAALHKLFKSSPQAQLVTVDQAQDQAQFNAIQDQECPQGTIRLASILASTAISKVRVDDEIKDSIVSALQHEDPYAEILTRLQGGMRQVTSNNVTYKFLNSSLFIHDQNQDVNLDFWRIIVPDDEGVKTAHYSGVAQHSIQRASWRPEDHWQGPSVILLERDDGRHSAICG